jgi:RNA polymerase sigma-32 factor
MSEDEKATLHDIPLPEIDLPKEVTDSEEDGSADKALVTFDPVQRYLAEIRRFPLLSREEEHRLAVDYKESSSGCNDCARIPESIQKLA